MLSHIRVTIDGFWIGSRIYWTLEHTTRDYNLQITITQRPLFLVKAFTALLGNVFQQWMFLCSRAEVLAGWRPSHTDFLLFKLPSQGSPVMATGLHYIASAWIAQNTPL
jgi:hypothetical protein